MASNPDSTLRFPRPQSESPPRVPVRRRWWPRGAFALAVVIGVLVTVQLGGGAVAQRVLNRKLANLEEYTARVGAVRLALWRGAVDVDDFVLAERDKPNEPPLVRVGHASLSAAMRPLLHGKIGGAGVVEDVELVFAKHHAFDGPLDATEKAAWEAERRKEQARRWQAILQKAVPMEIERFEMRRARIRYVDRSHEPNVAVELRDVRLVITGLQNQGPANGAEMPARLAFAGVTTGNGQLKLQVRADPTAESLRFSVALELRHVSLPELNDFLRAYVSADVARGRFELFSEITAEHGGYTGYVKPFFEDLDFKNVTDQNKGFVERAKEKVVSAAASLLKNDDEQKVATEIPFAGTFETGDTDVWAAVHNLLRNAFVQALREGLKNQPPPS